jgi:hypothetical protein
MKKDRAGRATAEAAMAAEVLFVTLTYRNGEAGLASFVVSDCQKMMKNLRAQQARGTLKRLGIPERGFRKDPVKLALFKAANPSLFFLRVGEMGKRKGRRHWHLLIWSDKITGLKDTVQEVNPNWFGRKDDPRAMKSGREHVDWWPHGWVQVQVLPGGRSPLLERTYTPMELIEIGRGRMAPEKSTDPEGIIKLCRYLHKYCEKSRGLNRRKGQRREDMPVVFGSSNRRPLGVELILDQAREWARAGLPYPGTYRVPGVRHSRGQWRPKQRLDGARVVAGGAINTGNAEADRILRAEWQGLAPAPQAVLGVMGACRRHACAAYRDEFWRVHRHAPDMSEFCRLYDTERCEGDYKRSPASFSFAGERARKASVLAVEPDPAFVPVYRDSRRQRLLKVVVDGDVLACIRVYATGAARTGVDDGYQGGRFSGGKLLVDGDLSRQLPQLDQVQREAVELRLREIRGEGWLHPVEYRAWVERLLMARDAAIAGFALPGERVLENPLVTVTAGVVIERAGVTVLQSDTALRRKMRMAAPAGSKSALPPWHHKAMGRLMAKADRMDAAGDAGREPDYFPVEFLRFGSRQERASRAVRSAEAVALARLSSAPVGVFDREAILATYDAAVRQVGGAKAARPRLRAAKVSPQQLPGCPAFVPDHFRQEHT